MNALLKKAQKQSRQLSEDLEQLKKTTAEGEDSGGGGGNSTNQGQQHGQISAGMVAFQRTLRELEESLRREISMEKRESAKALLKDLQADHSRFRAELDRQKQQMQEAARQKARADLLTVTHRAGGGGGGGGAGLTAEAVAEKESRTLDYTSSRLEEYISIGTNTLDQMRMQRNALKSTQRRILDAANSLGISQSIIRVIERRTSQDRIIFYGGVIVSILLIYLIIKIFT